MFLFSQLARPPQQGFVGNPLLLCEHRRTQPACPPRVHSFLPLRSRFRWIFHDSECADFRSA